MVFTIENLCEASRDGDIQTVRDIVTSKEVDINDTENNEWTPLMCAMDYNQAEIVRFLLTQPELQLDKRNSISETALHWACGTTVLRLFCQDRRCSPSVVNIKDFDGMTALMMAVYCGRLEIVKEMEKVEGIDFDTKDSRGRTLIEVARRRIKMAVAIEPASLNKYTAVLEYLLNRKKKTLKGMAANSVAKHLKNKEDIDALVDDQHILKSLKPFVADFIERLTFTIEDLYTACIAGNIQAVSDIVTSKEVDINDTDYCGNTPLYTPLMLAVESYHTEVVRFLLTQPELQLNKRNSDGRTALHWACWYNSDITIVRLLCQDKRCTPSVLNIEDNDGRTALMLAVYNGRLEIVKEMENVEGIDFDTKDKDGKSIIEVAIAMANMNNIKNTVEMLEYLHDRKEETLKKMAANSVTTY